MKSKLVWLLIGIGVIGIVGTVIATNGNASQFSTASSKASFQQNDAPVLQTFTLMELDHQTGADNHPSVIQTQGTITKKFSVAQPQNHGGQTSYFLMISDGNGRAAVMLSDARGAGDPTWYSQFRVGQKIEVIGGWGSTGCDTPSDAYTQQMCASLDSSGQNLPVVIPNKGIMQYYGDQAAIKVL